MNYPKEYMTPDPDLWCRQCLEDKHNMHFDGEVALNSEKKSYYPTKCVCPCVEPLTGEERFFLRGHIFAHQWLHSMLEKARADFEKHILQEYVEGAKEKQ